MNRLLLSVALVAVSCAGPQPIHPKAQENNGLCAQYLAQNNLDRAETYCDHGLEFAPTFADLWVNKGLIALKRNQIDAAKEDFIKALRFNQEHAAAYNDLGFVYFKNHEYGKAHDNFQRALKVNPDYVEARYNLALTFMSMNDKANARREYHTILAVNPNIADAHHDLGIMALEEHAYDEAISELTQAVRLDPKFGEAWANLGQAYMESAKYAESKDAFMSCLEVDNENVVCRNNLAIVNRKITMLDPSLKQIQDSDGLDATAPVLYQRSLTLHDKGLRQEEERILRKCVKVDGKYAPCHYGLYQIFREDRKDKEATIACKNFLKFAIADEFPKEVELCDKFVSAGN